MFKRLLSAVLCLCVTPSLAGVQMTPAENFQCAVNTYGVEVSEELDKKMEVKIDQLTRKAEFIFDIDLDIKWGYGLLSMNRTAGITFPHVQLIIFDIIYLNKYQEEFINTVTRHEISHAITYKVFGDVRDPHGEEWGMVMSVMGDKNPQRYHDYTFCED